MPCEDADWTVPVVCIAVAAVLVAYRWWRRRRAAKAEAAVKKKADEDAAEAEQSLVGLPAVRKKKRMARIATRRRESIMAAAQ